MGEEGTSSEEKEMLRDRAELRPRFQELAKLYPPMEFFEPPVFDSEQTAGLILDRMEELADTIRGRKFLYWWLRDTIKHALEERGSLVFHGSVVLTPGSAKDIDILSFGGISGYQRGRYVQDCAETVFGEGGRIMKQFFMANSLLILNPQAPVLGSIDKMREHIRSGAFFREGIGAMMLFAAYKAWRNREIVPGEHTLFDAMKFDIEWERGRTDGDIGSEPISPVQLNAQIREKMQTFRDDELMRLTRAAMRRIRVREEMKDELAGRFIRELRTKPVVSGSWRFGR